MATQVTVVVPTRNRPRLLAEALASIAAQTMPVDLVEAVVVNDGGSDIGAQAREAADHGLAVRVINLPTRRGLPTARNAGIGSARGEYVAFLDDDDVFLPHHLSTALAGLDTENTDAVYTTCLVSSTRTTPSGRVTAAEAFDHAYDPGLLSVCNFIPVHSMVIRHPRRTGAAFDPTLSALEDWDMWLRLVVEHRYRIRHVSEPTVVYHRIPNQHSMTGSAATQAAAQHRFGELMRLLWHRWPAASPKATRFRAYVGVMYWQALGHLVAGRHPSFWYYERCLRHIAAAWFGAEPEDELIDQIAQAVEEKPHAVHLT